MRSSPTLWTSLLLVLLLAFTSTTTAQSTNCHACMLKAIPTAPNCAGLSATQLDILDKIIVGAVIPGSVESYRTTDPAGLKCLTALMWDIVQYKGKLWGGCLDPSNTCAWAEMMQWMEIIPKVASIYGAGAPPALVLNGAPA